MIILLIFKSIVTIYVSMSACCALFYSFLALTYTYDPYRICAGTQTKQGCGRKTSTFPYFGGLNILFCFLMTPLWALNRKKLSLNWEKWVPGAKFSYYSDSGDQYICAKCFRKK